MCAEHHLTMFFLYIVGSQSIEALHMLPVHVSVAVQHRWALGVSGLPQSFLVLRFLVVV